jgi:hypothetical protein
MSPKHAIVEAKWLGVRAIRAPAMSMRAIDWFRRHRTAALLVKGGSLFFLLKGLVWVAIAVAVWFVIE